jgi:CRP-like cAMP-binding protein
VAAPVDALRRVSLFVGLDDEALEAIAQAASDVEVPAGRPLTQPGDAGTGMFFIVDGAAVVETKHGEIELGPGQFFGELALLKPDSIRTARVRAKTPLRCLALDRQSFRNLVATNPDVAAALLEVALGRLAENAALD